MSREFTMGIRLNYHDNDFTRGMREATRQTNSFRDGMATATRSASGFTSAIGAAAIALGGMAAAKKGFDWLIGANADMEQYQNTLAVVMKSQEEATKTLAWANKFAAQTPFEIPQIVEATTRMQSYGISAQKTLGVVGDMASVMGKDLMQAVEAVADAQTGELERLKEFGITKSMIQDQAKLLGSNPINSKGQISDTKAFNGALFALMEKRFKGGMAMQADGFKGMVSNAQDFMGSMGRKLGKPLFDRSKKQLEGFLTTLNQLQENGSIDRFISKVHRAGAVVGNEMAYAGKVVRAAFRGMWNVANPIINGIRSNWAKWQPVIQTIGYSMAAFVIGLGSVKTALTAASIAMKVLNMTMLTNPIGWIILGVGLLIGGFIKLNGGIEGTKKVLAGWFNSLKAWYNSDGTQAWVQKAITSYKQLAAKAGEIFGWLQAQAVKYWPIIQAAVMNTFEYFKTDVIPILKKVLTLAVSTFTTIWAVAKPLGIAIYKFFTAIAPSIWGLVKGIAWAVTNILWPVIVTIYKVIADIAAAVMPLVISIVFGIIKAFTAVLKWASVIWPAVAKIISVVFAAIKLNWAILGPWLMATLQVIGAIITGGFKVIMAVVKFIWTTISSIIKVAWAVISGIIQTALGILTGDWKMAWEGFKSIFEGVWNGITTFLGGVGKLFYDSGKAIIETLVSGIKSVASAPVNAVKGILNKVREFLPFSDAKKGPLSQLTYSGGAIMTTLSKGVGKQASTLQDAVRGAFSNTALGMSIAATAAAPRMAATPSFSAGDTNIAPTQMSAVAPIQATDRASAPVYNIGDINIHATEGMDGKQLYLEFIAEFYNQAKKTKDILGSGNRAALL